MNSQRIISSICRKKGPLTSQMKCTSLHINWSGKTKSGGKIAAIFHLLQLIGWFILSKDSNNVKGWKSFHISIQLLRLDSISERVEFSSQLSITRNKLQPITKAFPITLVFLPLPQFFSFFIYYLNTYLLCCLLIPITLLN